MSEIMSTLGNITHLANPKIKCSEPNSNMIPRRSSILLTATS